MQPFAFRAVLVGSLITSILLLMWPQPVRAELTAKKVIDSIDRGKRFLLKQQRTDGSWRANNSDTFQVGVSSLALLALLNAGMTVDAPEVARGLKYLRECPEPNMTYETSLMIMALAAAKDGRRDTARILNLVRKLEESQIRQGDGAGTWSYGSGRGGMLDLGGDRSNGQYAVLALREAQDAGVPVSLETWKRARAHWSLHQNRDGGWGYSGNSGSTGSMTVAGIATMVITEAMVQQDDKNLNADGTPNCCAESPRDKSVEDGVRWMDKNFSINTNPHSNTWLLYYLYGLERAGRLSGMRFFGEGQQRHDWYREGADRLVEVQSRLTGSWTGVGAMETDPVVGTSFALLFLSKGLAPVIVNKLEYNARDEVGKKLARDVWNKHRNDVRNLVQLVSSLPKWPKLLTWQVVDFERASVGDLVQSPVLFINGDTNPRFTAEEVGLLKDYLAQGGFIYAQANCGGEDFDRGFRELVQQMYPQGEARLQQLGADHPVFRSEYLIDAATVELWGVDVGCRTSIIYSPHDISCLWDKWAPFETPGRSPQATGMITKGTRIGVNILAYATGREPPNKLDQQEVLSVEGAQDKIERGYLQIAKLRHTGGWDAAPQAVRNLLLALNKTVGMAASTKQRNLTVLDPNLFKYPMLYMHGRTSFQMTATEQDRLRDYLSRGGVLFADACCGSAAFDRSFREMAEKLFPDQKLQRIPPDHEMFTSKIGHDLQRVKRRELDVNSPDAALKITVRNVEPYLEGIEVDGKYVLIYSKYDISCALERQASVACAGYVHDDAVRLAVNVVLYALLQ